VSEQEFSLIARVRRGEINFERLVEVLSTRGYVLDTEDEVGLGFSRPHANNAKHADFEALFKVLMPGQHHDIQLSKIATDQGGTPGAFTYAIYNPNVIDYDSMLDRLEQVNQEFAKHYE